MNDYRDRLVHVLLEGELGHDAPPDVTEKVLARAFGWRRRLGWAAGVAAAAAILVAGLALWTTAYPSPVVTGQFTVMEGGTARRGSTLATADGQAAVVLGGYCRVELDRNTQVKIEGDRRREALLLERGGLTCQVESGRGTFCVRTELGEVWVTGTEFVVCLDEPNAEQLALGKRMRVRVLAGSVSVRGAWGKQILTAGEEKTVFKSGPAAMAKPGRIEAGMPTYAAKPTEAWKNKGRIVGAARHAPAFTVSIVDAAGKEVKTVQADTPKNGARGYEAGPLEPGVYALHVAAEGYIPLQLENLEVRANQDLRLNLEFTP